MPVSTHAAAKCSRHLVGVCLRRAQDAERDADDRYRSLLAVKIELLERRRPDVGARFRLHPVDDGEEIDAAQIKSFDRVAQRPSHEMLWPAGIEQPDLRPPIGQLVPA